MSRSATDATRFTATSPHAYTKPTSINRASGPSTYSASSSTPRPNPLNARRNPDPRTPPPPIDSKQGNTLPTETPAEKVARLRQARFKEREAQTTRWDRLVIRGRAWADTAHKATVLGIVGVSIVATAITTFALTDMILHNRRKRSAFYAEQHAIYGQRLLEAIESEKSGLPLDEDQTLVINRERARIQAEEAARQRSWGKKIRGFLLGDLKSDDDDDNEDGAETRAAGEAVAAAVPSEGEILQKLGIDQTKILERATTAQTKTSDRGNPNADGNSSSRGEGGSKILQAVAEKRREGESVSEAAAGGAVAGGPLDRMAERAVEAVGGEIRSVEEKVGGGSSSSSWTNWWSKK